MPKTIELLIPLKGIATGKTHASYTTSGFTGTACTDQTAFMQQALGAVQSVEPTSEMYDVDQRHEHMRLDGDSPDVG